MAERNESVDIAKGIGILLVVIGHSSFFNFVEFFNVNKYIYSFHVPFFIFISGFLNKNREFKVVMLHKFRTVLYPFIYWSILYFIFMLAFIFFFNYELLSNHYNSILYIFLGSGKNSVVYPNVTLWFLALLFSVHLLHCFFLILPKNLLFILVLLSSMFGVGLSSLSLSLPYQFDSAFTLYPFFYLGCFLSRCKNSKLFGNDNTSGWFLLIFFVFIIFGFALSFNNIKIDTASNIIGDPIVFYCSATASILGFFVLSKIIRFHFLTYLGQNSMIFLIFHLPCIYIINGVQELIYGDFNELISLPLTLIIIVPIVAFFNSNPNFLLGRFYKFN